MIVTDRKPQTARERSAQPRPDSSARSRASEGVLGDLETLCDSLAVGDRLPSHPELMRRFGASERAVREALDVLQLRQRIVRRQGSGTYVADAPELPAVPLPAPVAQTSIVAIAAADHGFFDQSVGRFCRQAESANLVPVCRPIGSIGTFLGLSDAARNDFARSLLDPAASGFLIFSYNLEPLARRLGELGARVVLFGTPRTGATPLTVPCVCGDQEYGGYLVTRRMIDLGHRRIAFFQPPGIEEDHPEPWLESLRWRGHQRALDEERRRGVDLTDSVISAEIAGWKADPSLAAAFFRSPQAPTAVVCWNDLEAAHALSILARAGVRVPDEVSVTGYDDMPEAQRMYPALTTVDPSLEEMIRVAVDLVTRPESPEPGKTVLVPRLVIRDSTAPPPVTC